MRIRVLTPILVACLAFVAACGGDEPDRQRGVFGAWRTMVDGETMVLSLFGNEEYLEATVSVGDIDYPADDVTKSTDHVRVEFTIPEQGTRVLDLSLTGEHTLEGTLGDGTVNEAGGGPTGDPVSFERWCAFGPCD